MKRLIAPSILAADFTRLGKEIEMINRSEADWIHMDIMDGVFVPNISFGIPIVKAVKKNSIKPLDVHLMIIEPGRYIEDFFKAGASVITVHVEASRHLNRIVNEIKSYGIKAGVSLNPHTPVSVLEEIIPDLDLVLIMSVNPGFGGQKFIPSSINKIRKLKELILSNNSDTLIEVDGGVDENNAGILFDAGVDVLVAGTTVFHSENPVETINRLKNA